VSDEYGKPVALEVLREVYQLMILDRFVHADLLARIEIVLGVTKDGTCFICNHEAIVECNSCHRPVCFECCERYLFDDDEPDEFFCSKCIPPEQGYEHYKERAAQRGVS
jgi:hypothetical protein